MSSIRTFEDLIAWQRAMDLAEHVYDAASRPPFAGDRSLASQIRSSAASVPSNIAEGFERGSRPHFHHFLSIAKGSCGELRTQVYLANRIGYLSNDLAEQLVDESIRVAQIIGKLRAKVAQQRSKPRVPRAASRVP